MTEKELDDMQKDSEVFSFVGFLPVECEQLLAEVRRLKAYVAEVEERNAVLAERLLRARGMPKT